MTSMVKKTVLLRCSIIVNVAVLLYVASHMMLKPHDLDNAYYDIPEAQAVDKNVVAVVDASDLRVRASPSPPDARGADAGGGAAANNRIDEAWVEVERTAETKTETAKGQSPQTSSEELGRNLPSTSEPWNENLLTPGTRQSVARLLGCHDRDFVQVTKQRGEFWTLQNYVMADHGPISCYESVTYTTHADYTFLDNLLPLVSNWLAPISISLYTPGTDLEPTIDSIRYVRDCLDTPLIKQYVSFHVYFSNKHIPKQIPKSSDFLKKPYNCLLPPPYESNRTLYKTDKKLLYPINIGRNLARDAALTHFILPSDIELYPSPNLVPKFLNMIARNKPPLNMTEPRVFPLSIFEVNQKASMPQNKTELLAMLRNKTAILFHQKVCPTCHKTPKAKEWQATPETTSLEVFEVGKRVGPFVHWEPIFIGTHVDPLYEERQSWEGKRDKMTQGYVLCVKNYDFMILNNAFLVHKPGIKVYKRDKDRDKIVARTNMLINKVIFPELKMLFGTRKGCTI